MGCHPSLKSLVWLMVSWLMKLRPGRFQSGGLTKFRGKAWRLGATRQHGSHVRSGSPARASVRQRCGSARPIDSAALQRLERAANCVAKL